MRSRSTSKKATRVSHHCVGLAGQKVQARRGQFGHPSRVIPGEVLRRQYVGGGRFRYSQELSEEAALREQLVLHDFFCGAGSGVRPERKVSGRERAPYRDDLVGLAGVGVEQVLQKRRSGLRHIGNCRGSI
ncbi:MAG TPA: hypothetical protein VJV74_15975, partial [Terriglobia bacterium]|nr:hypothetical protein [Terriglobia bacterium]